MKTNAASKTPKARRDLPAQPAAEGLLDKSVAEQVRADLCHYGAPLLAPARVRRGAASLEVTLAAALRLAHDDPAVAGTLPVVLWMNRNQLDTAVLTRLATSEQERQTLGFFFELTDELAGTSVFAAAARPLHGKRLREPTNFFSRTGGFHAYERELALLNSPPVAKRWHFLMNLSLESFQSYFQKGTRPTVRLHPPPQE